MKSLYTVIFEDGSSFLGGTYRETKWMEIPDKKIKRIIYTLPNGDNLVLSGYDSYFHMCEATMDVNGIYKGETKLKFDYIMGKKNGYVTSYKINLFTGIIMTGYINKTYLKEDTDFIKKLNKKGWKGIKKEEEKK